MHLLIGFALEKEGHVGLDLLHVPTWATTVVVVVVLVVVVAAGLIDLGGLGRVAKLENFGFQSLAENKKVKKNIIKELK